MFTTDDKQNPRFMKPVVQQSFSFILPFTVLVIIPILIEHTWTFSRVLVSVTGGLLGLIGIGILVISVSTIVRIGEGTLAPWNPARRLVTTGIYSHVRNPMITGVLICLLAEAMIFGSNRILTLLIVFFLVNHIYFIFIEEPGLLKKFGKEYLEYKNNVPRWIPRWKPWTPFVSQGRDLS